MIENAPSRRTLDKVPPRALRFLSAVGRSRAIRAALAKYGYDEAAHEQGWRRLHATAGYAPAEATDDRDVEVVNAIAWLDAWDNRWFTVADASLRFNHPGAHEVLFAGGLKAEEGAASLLAVRTFLDRLDALDDAAARATLEKRGLTEALRGEARARLAQAERVAPVPAAEPAADDSEARQALWAWLTEWSAIARTAIERRDHLIRLGLARRRGRAVVEVDDDEETETDAPEALVEA